MKKIAVIFLTCIMVLFITPGCYKVATVTVDNSPAITKTVSLKSDLVPVFSKSCVLSGCHTTGGQAPDLSSDNVFNSLTSGNFINKTTPPGSRLYLWLTGKEAIAMPIGAPNNPSNINALVLAWISQGAKNN